MSKKILVTAEEMTAMIEGVGFNRAVQFEFGVRETLFDPDKSHHAALVILAEMRGVEVSDGDRARAVLP